MSIGSIEPSLTARMWLLFLPKWLLPAPHHTCFQQLSRQSSATACFNKSNGSSEISITIVNFHPTEVGLTSKLGRISPGVYRWHQKQSIYVPRPCLNVVIIQSVCLVSWKLVPACKFVCGIMHAQTKPVSMLLPVYVASVALGNCELIGM